MKWARARVHLHRGACTKTVSRLWFASNAGFLENSLGAWFVLLPGSCSFRTGCFDFSKQPIFDTHTSAAANHITHDSYIHHNSKQ